MLAICAALVAAGCTAAGTSPGGQADAVIVYGHKGQVPTIDPAHADYSQTDDADRILYDTLVDYNPRGQLVGGLASHFAYTKDVRSISLTLRDDVKFHDGAALTARDVKYTLDRNRKIGQGIETMMTSYRSTKVINDHQLSIRLKAPDALFLGALSRIYIVNSTLVREHAGSDHGQQWLASNEAGSGPYVLKSLEPSRIEALRYDGYWNFRPGRPDRFVEMQVDEPAARRDGLTSGRLSAADLDVHDLEAAQNAGLRIYRSTGNGLMSVYFNTSYGITTEPALRKAISLAFDYRNALDQIELGAGRLADGPLPPNLACRPDLPTVRQDRAKAKNLLATAGIKNPELTLRFQPAFSDQVQVATLLQSNLAEIGIKLKLQPITFPAYLTTLGDWKKIPEMMIATESPAYPDPGVMLVQSYDSRAVGTNKTAYKNPAVDQLLHRAATTAEPQRRCSLYRRAQKIVNDDQAVMPMIHLLGAMGYSKNLIGIAPNAVSNGFDLARLEVKR